MSATLLPRLFQAGGLTIVAAVVLGCAAPADASCGDHVKILDPAGTARAPADPDHAPAKAPCHGPGCTGGPKAPVPVFPASVSQSSDAKAIGSNEVGDPDRSVTGWLAPPSAGVSVRHPSVIFHPPRA